MYIFFPIVIFFLNYSNFWNIFLKYFLVFFFIYFYTYKNILTIAEYGIFLEDRVMLFLENIIRHEYNLFILFILFFFIFFYFWRHSVVLCYLIYLISFFFFESASYQEIEIYYFQSFKLNTKLLNGFFLVHPYLIYIFYSLFALQVVWLHKMNSCLFFIQNINKNGFFGGSPNRIFYAVNVQKKTIIELYLFMFGFWALVLGSWWAYQEVNWAGWWSWDIIEILNIILLGIVLNSLHEVYFFKLGQKGVLLIFFKGFFLIIFFLIISRYNLINSLHTFVISKNFEQYGIFFMLLLLFTGRHCLSRVPFLVKQKNKYTQNILKHYTKIKLLFYIFVFIFLFRVYYECLLYFFEGTPQIEVLYFYKSINLLLVFYFMVSYIELKIPQIYIKKGLKKKFSILQFFFFRVFFFFFNFIEVLFAQNIITILFKQKWIYFLIHFFFFFFCLVVFYNIGGEVSGNISANSLIVQFWNYTFVDYITNIKINNTLVLKKKILYYLEGVSNIYNQGVDFLYLIDKHVIFFKVRHCIIFFLSNFYFYFSYIFIFNYKLFFYYGFMFFSFFKIYFCFYFFLTVHIIFLKKKINRYFFF